MFQWSGRTTSKRHKKPNGVITLKKLLKVAGIIVASVFGLMVIMVIIGMNMSESTPTVDAPKTEQVAPSQEEPKVEAPEVNTGAESAAFYQEVLQKMTRINDAQQDLFNTMLKFSEEPLNFYDGAKVGLLLSKVDELEEASNVVLPNKPEATHASAETGIVYFNVYKELVPQYTTLLREGVTEINIDKITRMADVQIEMLEAYTLSANAFTISVQAK